MTFGTIGFARERLIGRTCVVVPERLYAEYLNAATQIGIGRKRGPAEFGERLAKLVPGIRRIAPAIETEPGFRQGLCYEMPSLDECRAAFDSCSASPSIGRRFRRERASERSIASDDDHSGLGGPGARRSKRPQFKLINKIRHSS